MISIGGYPVASNGDAEMIRDYLPQGISVFDLTTMGWSADYDPSVGKYVTPQVIKDDYALNGNVPQSGWSNPQVEKWFTTSSKFVDCHVVAFTNKQCLDSSSSTNSTQPAPSNKSSSNTGAIAGGVVGGVVGLAIIALLAWFLLRRRRADQAVSPKLQDPSFDPQQELDTPAYNNKQYHDYPPELAQPEAELSAVQQAPVYELGDRDRSELNLKPRHSD